MELSDLVGYHKLSGVDTGVMAYEDSYGDCVDCNFVKFALDGVFYLAVEDPEDGYRSRCRELVISEEAPRFSFPPQAVECYMKDGDPDYGCDVLVMKDEITDEIVLEVGTGDYNDWYPYCHFEYHPEGMACNNPIISENAFDRIIRS